MDKWKVIDQEVKTKLLPFLKSKYQDKYTLKQIRFAIEHHRCRVNGIIERFASKNLSYGSIVEIEIAPNSILFESTRLLFEDDHFIAYDKPTNISSLDGLDKILESSLGPLFPVHRLDRDTTGILLFAKTLCCRDHFKSLFQKHKMNKHYSCLVAGAPSLSSGILNANIVLQKRLPGKVLYETSTQCGKSAITKWICEKKGLHFSLLTCMPITGRTHQIRVHLKYLGCPIVGDIDYGSRKAHPIFQPKRPLLHAHKLFFPHPITEQKISILSPLPEDFQEGLKYL